MNPAGLLAAQRALDEGLSDIRRELLALAVRHSFAAATGERDLAPASGRLDLCPDASANQPSVFMDDDSLRAHRNWHMHLLACAKLRLESAMIGNAICRVWPVPTPKTFTLHPSRPPALSERERTSCTGRYRLTPVPGDSVPETTIDVTGDGGVLHAPATPPLWGYDETFDLIPVCHDGEFRLAFYPAGMECAAGEP